MTASDTHRTIDAVWRIESARLIGGLARIVRDVGLAEELAQDALVAALEQWPESGVPDNPGAWLMATAKHRAIDLLRRNKRLERKHEELGRRLEAEQAAAPDLGAALDDDIGDDLLRLVFTACHPVLSTEARVALTLRLLGGLTTEEIARAYLVPEPTVAQRIVRAKRTLAEKQVPIEVPRGAELADRLSSVLEVIYLVFNEGYTATAGDDWMRPALCEEALRLGRILAGLMPREPEVHGLVALLEIQASRSRARVGPSGEPIVLFEQNRALWDQLLIRRGLAALERAEKLGGPRGWYALQAAIAACHARARAPAETDWARIVALYGELARLAPSPVVELNRAVAVSMAFGPQAGLVLVGALAAEPSLEGYHLLPTVRGDLLAKLGRFDEARAEFERAAALTRNARERALLLERARACAGGSISDNQEVAADDGLPDRMGAGDPPGREGGGEGPTARAVG
jgi:RNA polymerase sigma factor (sigma-70 family)